MPIRARLRDRQFPLAAAADMRPETARRTPWSRTAWLRLYLRAHWSAYARAGAPLSVLSNGGSDAVPSYNYASPQRCARDYVSNQSAVPITRRQQICTRAHRSVRSLSARRSCRRSGPRCNCGRGKRPHTRRQSSQRTQIEQTGGRISNSPTGFAFQGATLPTDALRELRSGNTDMPARTHAAQRGESD